MSEPDFDKLRSINDELEKLADDGELTQAEFDRLFAEAEKAVGEHTEFLESVLLVADVHGLKIP